ncbi:unnamed protein product [Toxocara canis]|uniref:WGR domain-containing protein n=1 Tax=Toxocara canis TaxID=6265 RepID=A0A183TWA5_TOXCA|nr:unnamed protein product [Toxocara canis]
MSFKRRQYRPSDDGWPSGGERDSVECCAPSDQYQVHLLWLGWGLGHFKELFLLHDGTTAFFMRPMNSTRDCKAVAQVRHGTMFQERARTVAASLWYRAAAAAAAFHIVSPLNGRYPTSLSSMPFHFAR